MQEALTVFFSFLAGGATFWLIQELREYSKARSRQRDLDAERAAAEGMRLLGMASEERPVVYRNYPYG